MIKLGLVDGDGSLLARRRLPYAEMASFEDLAERIAHDVRAMERDSGRTADALGIAVPGYARPDDGVMIDGTSNVPLLKDRSLAQALHQRLGLGCSTINDGSAATLGELLFGAGRGVARFALLTLGTGVGGGIVVHGRLATADDGVPPELGAMVLDDAPAGARTLEDFASAGGFARAYARCGGTRSTGGLSPDEIFRRAASGEAAAIAAIDVVARRLAQGFGSLTNALGLELCLVGGGIAGAGEPLLDRIRVHFPQFTWPFLRTRCRIDGATTGEDAGVLGAAAAAVQPSTSSIE
jgi:glucokinase